MKLFLVGMPASGKSRFGKKIATELGLPFLDLDSLIEDEVGMTVPGIFEQHGEAYFREVEARLLRQHTSEHAQFVMATGGGAAVHHQGMEFMNDQGTTLWLDMPLDMLVDRAYRKRNKRPLLASTSREEMEQKVRATLERRRPRYALAHHRITEPIKNARALCLSFGWLSS